MKRLDLDTKLVFLAIGTFLLAYLFTFPTGWLISDVYSYLNQGIAIANGDKLLTYQDAVANEIIAYNHTRYPLGNAFWIAFWIKLCGLKYVYVGSLFSVVLSLFFMGKILMRKGFLLLSILLVFIYPSFAFFSNTLMSSIPSLLTVSLFLYGLYMYEDSGKKWFLLSFIAAFSFWIRETNLVLLGGVCLIHFLQDKRWFYQYAGGAVLGFLPRLISANYYYGDPFYYVLAEHFSILNLVNNIGVYSILLLCFMPLGLYFLGKYRGRYFRPLIGSTFLFIAMYAFYSFNATEYSGFEKGVILMGRFLLPVLPIYIIAVGWYFREKLLHKYFGYAATIFTCSIIVVMQIFTYKEAKIHKRISNHIYANYSDKLVMYDLSRTTNIVRYINPYHGNLSWMSDISNLQDDQFMFNLFSKFEKAYLIQTLNTVHAEKAKYTSLIDDIIKGANQKYNIEEVEVIKIKPNLYLQVLMLKAKDGKEK